MTFDPKLVEDLKKAHGSIHSITVPGVDDAPDVSIIVREPSRAEWHRFKKAREDDQLVTTAPETLVRDVCVHPGKDELALMLQKQPALADSFTNRICIIAGASTRATNQKL